MPRILIVVALLLAGLTTLVWVGLASVIPVVSVAQLPSGGYQGGDVEIKDSKVHAIESLAPLRFTVSPRAGLEPLIRVESERVVPDNFKLGIDVGLQGSYDPQKNVFRAYRITTKCPSKYEASKEGLPGGGYAPQPAAASGAPASAPGSKS